MSDVVALTAFGWAGATCFTPAAVGAGCAVVYMMVYMMVWTPPVASVALRVAARVRFAVPCSGVRP